MNPNTQLPSSDNISDQSQPPPPIYKRPFPPLPTVHTTTPSPSSTSSPRCYSSPTLTPTSVAQRRIAIAVDLSDESAYAVKWAVHNYLRPGDAVILLHVRPTSVLYGADWGAMKETMAISSSPSSGEEVSQQKLEDDYDNLTTKKAANLAQPLVESNTPFKIHIVNDHDMKERLCLEVERLGLSAVIMGSRGFGALKKTPKGRLGSMSDYCVHHCVCPVVVVRYPEENFRGGHRRGGSGGGGSAGHGGGSSRGGSGLKIGRDEIAQLHAKDPEFHDAPNDHQKGV